MISMCSIPKKPQRKPKPSAAEDSGSGVDYSSIAALDQDGRQAAPLQVDEAGQTAVFSCPEHFLDVCVPDRAGNTLHLRITMK